MRNYFGIRLRNKAESLFGKKGFKLQIIFYYAVVHDRKSAFFRQMRVRVDVVRFTVRRPAGVTHSDRTVKSFAARR